MGSEKINTKHLDALVKKKDLEIFSDFWSVRKHKKSAVLFTKHGTHRFFYTQDSKRYITPDEYEGIKRGVKLVRITNRLDSALSRNFEKNRLYSIVKQEDIYLAIQKRYANLENYIQDLFAGAVQGVSMVRMWNLSIVGAVIFGMLTMTMIYEYLGQNVSAAVGEIENAGKKKSVLMEKDTVYAGNNVVDVDNLKDESVVDNIDTSFVTKLLKDFEEIDMNSFEKELLEMVKGYPIETMIPEIAKKDKKVAAFIVAIAKKESAWGKRVPVLDGKDCYNYWGYRGIRDKMGTGGHTCFDSPKDAVDTVAKRIEFLVSNKKLNTPSKMIIWKCGSDCSVTGGQAAADKWIMDVAMYFDKLNKN